MKVIKLLLFLLSLNFSVIAQEQTLPDSILDKIILTLHDYEALKVKYNQTDSTLQVYVEENKRRESLLLEAKATQEQYDRLVQKLNLRVVILEDKVYEARKKIRKLVIAHVVRTVLEVGVIVLLIAL